MTAAALPPGELTLGILAGGLATRLGGRDKAWLERDGLPQVQRWQRRFANEVSAVLVSANRDFGRYASCGLHAVPDRQDAGAGPVAGLEALALACATPWLLTLPVDLFGVNDCLLPTLAVRDAAVRDVQSRLAMRAVTFAGVRFGNLNTFEDLRAAGIAHDD